MKKEIYLVLFLLFLSGCAHKEHLFQAKKSVTNKWKSELFTSSPHYQKAIKLKETFNKTFSPFPIQECNKKSLRKFLEEYGNKLEHEVSLSETSLYFHVNGKREGLSLRCDRSNKTFEVGFYKNGKKEGGFFNFDREQKLKSLCFYENDLAVFYALFHPKGVIQTSSKNEKNYRVELYNLKSKHMRSVYKSLDVRGKRAIGEKVVYSCDGGLSFIEHFNKKGEYHGDITYYYPDGNISKKVTWEEGLKVGDAYSYFSNGKISEKSTYYQGELIYAHRIDKKGRVIYSLSYENGQKIENSFHYTFNDQSYNQTEKRGFETSKYRYMKVKEKYILMFKSFYNKQTRYLEKSTYKLEKEAKYLAELYVRDKNSTQKTLYFSDKKIKEKLYKNKRGDGYIKSYNQKGKLIKEIELRKHRKVQ